MNNLEQAVYKRHRAYDRWALTLTQPYPDSPTNILRIIYTGDRVRRDWGQLEKYQYEEERK